MVSSSRVHRGPQTISLRSLLYGAMGCLVIMAFYFNLSYHTSYPGRTRTTKTKRPIPAAATTTHSTADQNIITVNSKKPVLRKESQDGDVDIEHKISKILFTTTCGARDLLYSQVLSYTARDCGYLEEITNAIYDCLKDVDEDGLNDMKQLKLDTKITAASPDIQTSIHAHGVQEWLQSADAEQMDPNDYVMLVEKNAIFVKEPTLELLQTQTTDVTDPKGFGQDASFYVPQMPILPKEVIKKVCGKDSPAMYHADWRPYAVEPPFVIKKRQLRMIMPTYLSFWDKLDDKDKHLAYPLALGHLKLEQGISGSLRVGNYGSRMENWDFSDDMTHNPCNMTARDDLGSDYYPFTISAKNFALDTWADGRGYQFSDALVPDDILQCDGWLLKDPPSSLWPRAVQTLGFEGVTSILRRRHIYSVCTASRKYNAAIRHFREENCTLGFNTNEKLNISSALYPEGRGSSLPYGGTKQDTEFVYYGDVHRIEPKEIPPVGSFGSEDIHFVFTTTCTGYQDWQTENLMYSAFRVKQPGRFTRILCGCTHEKTREILRRGSSNPKLQYHVTADFKDHPYPEINDPNYTPYGKPFGIKDWLKNANPPVKESLIVIIDPDFYFLRQFHVNTNIKERLVYTGKRDASTVNDTVQHGLGLAQNWKSYLGALAFTKDREEENKKLCGTGPECQVSEADAREYYSVGPPYALMREDLESFVADYCNITVSMRQLHPKDWMAEMYGYSMAAAKHKIKHTNVDNLAVTLANTEYWGFVNKLKENPCEDPEIPLIPADAPYFLHACQGFDIVTSDNFKWRFYKQLMPEDIYACDSWMLEPPPAEVWTAAKASSGTENLWKAYGVCTLTKLMNLSLLQFKKNHCPGGFNANKALRLISPRPDQFLKVGKSHTKWDYAGVIRKEIEAQKKKDKT